MLVIDLDDFHNNNHRLDLLHKLRDINPLFKCTVFAIPKLCTPDFLLSLPHWIEVCPHGEYHPTPTECEHWGYTQSYHYLESLEKDPYQWPHIWKSPGWQTSPELYKALADRKWAIADHPDGYRKRPTEMAYYDFSKQPGGWHGHIQNVCGNGLEESFTQLQERVANELEFRWVSKCLQNMI